MPTSLTDTGSGSLNIEGLYQAARAIMILSTPVFFIISVMSLLLLRREHCCLWVKAINYKSLGNNNKFTANKCNFNIRTLSNHLFFVQITTYS